jgi:hypothetical protein
MWHAWYSAEAVAVGCPTAFYRREDGSEVEVSVIYVEKASGDEAFKWPDKVYLGVVMEFLRKGREKTFGEKQMLMNN